MMTRECVYREKVKRGEGRAWVRILSECEARNGLSQREAHPSEEMV